MASRNRPRSSFTKDDMTDEQQLWQSIVEKIRRCDSARQQYDSNATKKAALEQEMKDFKGCMSNRVLIASYACFSNGYDSIKVSMKISAFIRKCEAPLLLLQ